jgi:hypothetical protein
VWLAALLYFTTCYNLSSSQSRDAIKSLAKYLQRFYPNCNGYLGIVVPERGNVCRRNSSDEDLLVAPSLHAFIENLPLVASASKGGLTLALIQVAVTIFINLHLGGVAQS